jgi:hypothetical protein
MAAEPLMKTLGAIVLNKLLDHVAQMAFAEEDELVETLVLDGFHRSLGVRIAIAARAGIFAHSTPPGP